MMGMEILSTGDKILHTMKEMEMSIPGLAALSGVNENTLLDIMAGIREPHLLSVKLDAPAPCRLVASDLDFACRASADCLPQHLQVI